MALVVTHRRRVDRINLNVRSVVFGAVLQTLGGTFNAPEDIAQGATIGSLTNTTVGSTLTLIDDAGGRVALSGTNVVRGTTGLDYEGDLTHDFIVEESYNGETRQSTLTLTVSNVLEVTLNALGGSFSLAENAAAAAVAGGLTGTTAGATLTLIDDAGGRVALSGTNIVRGATSLDYETATSHSFTVRETHADGSNSPRDTVLSLAVTNVLDAASLGNLTGTFSLSESAVQGAVAGALSGKTTGSTLSILDDAGGRVALSGTSIVRGVTALDYETATSHSFTVRETLADSPNSPRDTVFSLTVTNAFEQPTLVALSLSTSSIEQNEPVTISIVGATAGSTLSVDTLPAGLTLNSGARTISGTPTALATTNFALTETLADSSNSPRVTNLSIVVQDTTDATITSANPSGSYDEGVAIGGTLTANEAVTWSVSGTDAAAVTLDTNTGVWSLEATDYETKTSYSFTFTATDGSSNTSDQVVAITIQDVAEGVAPANTVAPVLSGTAQVGEILSVTNGTWTGTPAPTYTYQWQRDTGGGYTNISGETANTYLLTVADEDATVRCVVTGTNASGSDSANSNASATVIAADGLTAPDITVTSDAGDPPEVDIGLKSDHHAGFYLDIQRAANTSSDFTTLTMDIFYQIKPEDFTDGISDVELAAEDYVDPSGAYSQRYRIRREDGVVSPWVVITGTVTVSTGVLSTTTGTSKNSLYDTATYSGLGGRMTSNLNAGRGARTTVAITGKRHFEVTIVALSGVSGNNMIMGVCDLSADFSAGILPGGSQGPGASIRVASNSNNITQARNNSAASTTNMGSPIEVGDVYICEFDTDADTVSFWRHRSGTDTLIYTATLTSQVPTDYAAHVQGFNTNDQISINFGGSAFVKTPTSGYAGW